MTPPLKVTICGAGGVGLANAALLSQKPQVSVSVLTRRADDLRPRMRAGGVEARLPDGDIVRSAPLRITDDPAETIPTSDIVMIAAPAHSRRAILESIRPHVSAHREVFVGSIPGNGGFDWLARTMLGDAPNLVIWGLRNVPCTARCADDGISVRIGGFRARLYAGVAAGVSDRASETLKAHLQRLFSAPTTLLSHFLEITLAPGNPIMHTAALYGLLGPYSQNEGRLLPAPRRWWSEITELSAYFIQRADQERETLCDAIRGRYDAPLETAIALKADILAAYGDVVGDPRTLLTTLRTNAAYRGRMPLVPDADGEGYRLDVASRAIVEDVPFGLRLVLEIARRLGATAPHLEEIHDWCSAFLPTPHDCPRAYMPERLDDVIAAPARADAVGA